MRKSLLSSGGSEKNWCLTTQCLDQHFLNTHSEDDHSILIKSFSESTLLKRDFHMVLPLTSLKFLLVFRLKLQRNSQFVLKNHVINSNSVFVIMYRNVKILFVIKSVET